MMETKILFELIKMGGKGLLLFSGNKTHVISRSMGSIIDFDINPFCSMIQSCVVFNCSELNELKKAKIKEVEVVVLGPSRIVIKAEGYVIYSDPVTGFLLKEFNNKEQVLFNLSISKELVRVDNIKEEEDFTKVLAMKAADGAGRIKVNTSIGEAYFILSPRMLPINKSDKVAMTVYQYIDNHLVIKLCINKGKGIILNVYYKQLLFI